MSAPDCYTERKVKARKKHRCCECRSEIAPGEHYVAFSGIWDGECSRYKTCLLCNSLRDVLNECDASLTVCLAFGGLIYHIMDDAHYYKTRPGVLGESVCAFLERRERAWERMEKERDEPCA